MVQKADMPKQILTAEIIAAAIEGYEFQKTRIDGKIVELRAMLDGGAATPAATPEASQRRPKKFSAAARLRMKEAQHRRWTKIRGESEPPAPATPEAPKPKRRIGKAGMARIIAATKERWARVRAAKAQQEKATRKAARKKAAVRKAAPANAAKKSAALDIDKSFLPAQPV
jgi:hypothetical protein